MVPSASKTAVLDPAEGNGLDAQLDLGIGNVASPALVFGQFRLIDVIDIPGHCEYLGAVSRTGLEKLLDRHCSGEVRHLRRLHRR